ncbi:MAG: zinc ribbon domain-containing protein [Anaerolineae bacterium]|nr:zinc ribbon domain-containing protein [Anaerolineae bacterium]
MPVYVYQCPTCGQFEQRQSFNDPALQTCPTCGQPVRRLIRPAPIVFKGSGWYSTDSRSGSSSASSSPKTTDKKADDGKAEPTTETKSETKAETKTEPAAKSDG